MQDLRGNASYFSCSWCTQVFAFHGDFKVGLGDLHACILNQDEFSSNLTPPIPYNWGNTASQIRVGREMHFSNAGWSCNDCRLPGGCGWEICPPCAVHNSCSGLPLRSLPSGSVLIVTQKPRLGTHGQPHCADVPDWHDRRGSPFFYDHGPPFSWCFW